jgi:hypothetical protein
MKLAIDKIDHLRSRLRFLVPVENHVFFHDIIKHISCELRVRVGFLHSNDIGIFTGFARPETALYPAYIIFRYVEIKI